MPIAEKAEHDPASDEAGTPRDQDREGPSGILSAQAGARRADCTDVDTESVWAVVAARMGSSRLRGKSLADIDGRPALVHVIERLEMVGGIAAIVVATTDCPGDDALADVAAARGAAVFRGSPEDVLGRTVGALRSVGATVAVQVTGDCPLIDPALVKEGLDAFRAGGCDYVTNRPAGYPLGHCVEVFRVDDLARIEASTADPADREHVTLPYYEVPGRWRVREVGPLRPELVRDDVRLTLDTAEDLLVIRRVSAALGPAPFGLAETLAWLDAHPEVAGINHHVRQKPAREAA